MYRIKNVFANILVAMSNYTCSQIFSVRLKNLKFVFLLHLIDVLEPSKVLPLTPYS